MGKKLFIILLLNIILSLVQVSFVPILFSHKLYINLVLALSFGFLAVNKTKDAYISALISGLIMDILGITTIGISAFIFCTGLYIAYFIHDKFLKKYSLFLFIIPVDIFYQLLVLRQIEAGNIFLTFISFGLFYFMLKKLLKREDLYKL